MDRVYGEVMQLIHDIADSSECEAKGMYELLCPLLFSDSFADGLFHALFAGGIQENGFATGVIKAPSIQAIRRNHPDLDFSSLADTCHLAPSHRARYVLRILAGAMHSDELHHGDSKEISLLHLATYQKLSNFSDLTDLQIETLASYGLPALYVSHLHVDGDHISSCAANVVIDREAGGDLYNRGILFRIPDEDRTRSFYYDRKVNLPYRTSSLRKHISDPANKVHEPTSKELELFRAEMLMFLDSICSDTDPKSTLYKCIEFFNGVHFSIVGSALFELLHEYLVRKDLTVQQASNLIQQLDKSQKECWTLRGFHIAKLSELERVFAQYTQLSVESFASYLHRNLETDLHQYLGENREHLDDVCLDNVFFDKLHAIERRDFSLDPEHSHQLSFDILVNPTDRQKMEFDRTTKRLRFLRPITDQEADAILKSTDKKYRESLRQVFSDHRLKCISLHVKESLGAEIMRIVRRNDVGLCAARFELDTRGEYLLLPLLGPEVDCSRVEISSDDNGGFLILRGAAEKLGLRVKNYALFDPSVSYHLAAIDSNKQREDKERDLFHRFRFFAERVEEQVEAVLRRCGDREIHVVSIPFFKERETVVQVAIDSVKAAPEHCFTVLLLVSNLPEHMLERKVALIRDTFEAGLDQRTFLIPICTEDTERLQIWMSNKNMSFALALVLSAAFAERKRPVRYVALIEADLFNSSDWFKAIERAFLKASTLMLFDYVVYARLESGTIESKTPRIDIKENVFYSLIAKPLSHVLFGEDYSQIMGSSYVLGSDAAKRAIQHIYMLGKIPSIEQLLFELLPYLDVELVPIGRKVHFSSSMIDERFGYRIQGFLQGVEAKVMKHQVRWQDDRRVNIDVDIALLQEAQSPWYAKELDRARSMLRPNEQIYRDVLGTNYWLDLQGHLTGNVDWRFSDQEWLRILLRFFAVSLGKSDRQKREYFGALQPLALLKLRATNNPLSLDLSGLPIETDIVASRLQSLSVPLQNISVDRDARLGYVLTDVHGLEQEVRTLLKAAELVNPDGTICTSPSSSLVFGGDMIDRYSGKETFAEIRDQVALAIDLDQLPAFAKDTASELLSGRAPFWTLPWGEFEPSPHAGLELRTIAIDNQTVLLWPGEFAKLPPEKEKAAIQLYTFEAAASEFTNAFIVCRMLKWLEEGWRASNFVDGKSPIVFLLGNHEADLLSGRMAYRSLQKSMLLNLLGYDGIHDQEASRIKQGQPPIVSCGEVAEFHLNPSASLERCALLKWMRTWKIAALVGDALIMHGGPTNELICAITEGRVRTEVMLDQWLSRALDRDLSTKQLAEDFSILDPGEDSAYLTSPDSQFSSLLTLLGARRLAVGHNPYLALNAIGYEKVVVTQRNRDAIRYVGPIGESILKLDGGAKIDSSFLSLAVFSNVAFVSIDESGSRLIYDFRELRIYSKSDITTYRRIASLLESCSC